MKIGLDIGSTTIKCVVLDDDSNIIFNMYERHYSQIIQKTIEVLSKIKDFVKESNVYLSMAGSAGMGFAESCKIPFVQEVYATRVAANKFCGDIDCIIELGGEDAKILFLSNGLEVRMNGSCAGGTGAFIDQMATLLNVSNMEMNELAKTYKKLYTIASRCGVFAKSDIQPLINQGAVKEDISASIFRAVVNQTIAGLAQGRPIEGKVLYLGGPLTFLSELRKSFDDALNITGICPENSLYYVSLGTALCSNELVNIDELINNLKNYEYTHTYNSIDPLFKNEDEYNEFIARHDKEKVETIDINSYEGNVFLGIDSGSTTIKLVVINENGDILDSLYRSNSGNPIPIIKNYLDDFYQKYPKLTIKSNGVTGYGEDLVKNAFQTNYGIVETMAHYTAAKRFMPDVEFIIDIGGQDIKCFKIKQGTIDNIFLNEACSSGCGSFLQTFASALGYSIADFAKLGLKADSPVDLGSRCTVFMNSSVKQAQKDGASIENISAGLSISVVKNALYKVIRATSKKELGEKIVVQGGTFLNNSVLRAFEKELDLEVVRPNIAGLMGAYGVALYSLRKWNKYHDPSTILTMEQLMKFKHEVKNINCGLCNNNCMLTVNFFAEGKKFISGNRCERPITKKELDVTTNIYEYKRNLLRAYQPVSGPRGKIGLPMGLNMYELLPFWHTFFTSLGFEVINSPFANRELYIKGQTSIPSDTVCFPAKLMHGHIEWLIDNNVDTIFYPCMSYNLDEFESDNHYNCPVVAYYPEVIKGNMQRVKSIKFINDYIGLHRKEFPNKFTEILHKYNIDVSLKEVKEATKKAFAEYHKYMDTVKNYGNEIINRAREKNMTIIVLSGRPYHIDPEINHDIDKLLASFKVAIISEDVISGRVGKVDTHVLNQWTYHARLYSAAKYITTQPDMHLVQLVSFGCGVDAITTDEVRRIIEGKNKIYTQIKIDEIANLGAVKIRLRSLLAAIKEKEGK